MGTKKCPICRGTGYECEFAAGLYPLPCIFCGGTGRKDVASSAVRKRAAEEQKRAYKRIDVVTKRRLVAQRLISEGIVAGVSRGEGRKFETVRNSAHELSSFDAEYLQDERRIMSECWEHLETFVREKQGDITAQLVRKNAEFVRSKSLYWFETHTE